MKEAITKALEGGYSYYPKNSDQQDTNCRLWSDPLFWQALGKSLGWENQDVVTTSAEYREWQGQWHRFIDHLGEGKDPEEFFTNLLNP